MWVSASTRMSSPLPRTLTAGRAARGPDGTPRLAASAGTEGTDGNDGTEGTDITDRVDGTDGTLSTDGTEGTDSTDPVLEEEPEVGVFIFFFAFFFAMDYQSLVLSAGLPTTAKLAKIVRASVGCSSSVYHH